MLLKEIKPTLKAELDNVCDNIDVEPLYYEVDGGKLEGRSFYLPNAPREVSFYFKYSSDKLGDLLANICDVLYTYRYRINGTDCDIYTKLKKLQIKGDNIRVVVEFIYDY